MHSTRRLTFSVLAGLGLIASPARAQVPRSEAPPAGADVRTVAFETTQVTQADVTVSPDDLWLVFTIVGHLFRLPIGGGLAEQLTFGPYFDSDPAYSPDGRHIAFVSDREDSDRNVFVLEVATGEITQVTDEPWADRPIWSPDGEAIVYLSPSPEPRPFNGGLALGSAFVRRIGLGEADPETLSTGERVILSTFYLPDGRVAWTVMEPPNIGSSRVTTRIEVLSDDGSVSELQVFEAFADRVIASATGTQLYCRCYASSAPNPAAPGLDATEHLVLLPLGGGAIREIVPLSRVVGLQNLWNSREPLRFALTSDERSLYVGDEGRLWRIEASTGVREPVSFTARVELEVHTPVTPRKPLFRAPGTSAPPLVVQNPRLSPDGESLVFGAAGHVWQQRLDGGPARRLSDGNAFESAPLFSPDGQRVAYVRIEDERRETRVFDLVSGDSRSVALGDSWGVSWSVDGQRLVLVEEGASGDQVVAVTASDGRKEPLTDVPGGFRAVSTAEGQWVYLDSDQDRQLHRMDLFGQTSPEPLTSLERGVRDALVSPDGRWLTFRRNAELWVAPLGLDLVQEKDIRLLSIEGAEGYALTPDGSAAIYAVGNRVWLHRLADGVREEIPIRVELQTPSPVPLLLRRVRVLDFAAGGFLPEQSVYIDQGRITWIGSEGGRDISGDVAILDADGRFAIPGLFDMHTHAGTPGPLQEALIAYGVTAIRDLGSNLRLFNALTDYYATSAEAGPRAFYAGENFHTRPEPDVNSVVSIRDEDDARVYVRQWSEQGAYLIKPYSSLSWRLRRAAVEEARQQGLPVAGHGMSVEEITKSVTLGYTSLEHFDRHSRAYDDILGMLAAAGTRWDPALEGPWGGRLLVRNEPARLYDAKLQALMPASRIRAAQRIEPPISHNLLRGLWVDWLAGIERAHDLGVGLLAGTDAPAAALPGVSLHWELEHLVEAGLSPLAVLDIATRQAAEALGAQDDLGTLDTGKLADIVLLDRDPLENIRNTQTVWRVLKGGWLFNPDELDSTLSDDRPN